MFSQTIVAGRLGQDPTIRTTSGGKRVATFSLCTSTYSKKKEYTEWHTIVAWGDGLVKLIEERLHKGDLILVTGQNRTRRWEKEGQKHYSTEVVVGPNDTLKFLDVKKAQDDGHPPTTEPDLDDEIPF